MKKWQHRITRWVEKQLHFSPETRLDVPKITIIGQIHIYIENHKGLWSFSDTELKLASSNGFICIQGSGFVLNVMMPEEILLEGTIDKVFFVSK